MNEETKLKISSIFTMFLMLGCFIGYMAIESNHDHRNLQRYILKDNFLLIKTFSTTFQIDIISNCSWQGEINCNTIFGINGTGNQSYTKTSLINYCRIFVYNLNTTGTIEVTISTDTGNIIYNSTNKPQGYIYISYRDSLYYDELLLDQLLPVVLIPF